MYSTGRVLSRAVVLISDSSPYYLRDMHACKRRFNMLTLINVFDESSLSLMLNSYTFYYGSTRTSGCRHGRRYPQIFWGRMIEFSRSGLIMSTLSPCT
eukprot:8490865-Pyramimonas_sp.AAC.1